MKVSVIVCTLNRCESLRKALTAVTASRIDRSIEWEVVVVDNRSTDGTREVVEDFSSRHPGRFRYLYEANLGKSFALNTGVRAARGEVLAFMDDDATVEPDWLQNLTAPLGSGEWAGTGGRTLIAGTFSPPRWFGVEQPFDLRGILAAVFDLGSQPCELDRAPYGANMAFRKEAFEKYGLFRTDLGPSPDRKVPRPNEDTEFGRRVMAAGERLRYEPSAVVYHPVNQSRVHKSYFLSWHFDYGRAIAREWKRGPDILGIRREFFSCIRMCAIDLPERVARWTVARNPSRRFALKCWVWMKAGQIQETYRQWRSVLRSETGSSTTGRPAEIEN